MSSFLLSVTLLALVSDVTPVLLGKPARIRDFPFAVSITDAMNRVEPCSGSIISTNLVVTSAGCTRGHEELNLTVRAITDDRKKAGTYHQVDKIIAHPHYHFNDTPGVVNPRDIALLRVKGAFGSYLVVRLFSLGEKYGNATTGDVADFKHRPDQKFLYSYQVPLLGFDSCLKIFKDSPYTRHVALTGSVCTRGSLLGVVNLGAPLVVNGRLAGVYFGFGQINFSKATLFTDVAYHRLWIDSVVRQHAPRSP